MTVRLQTCRAKSEDKLSHLSKISDEVTESVLYENAGLHLTANVETDANSCGLNLSSLKENFNMIRQNRKVGET